jgi:hypothetical protein
MEGFPMRRLRLFSALCLFPVLLAAQEPSASPPTPGQFDLGKMWTFEYPPAEYFSSTYQFAADSTWFRKARMAALRIPGCSAAFVSSTGLIVTNHHCVRGAVNAISRPGESLLDSGFVAPTLADERPIPNMIADQMLAALDITDEVERAGGTATTLARLKAAYASAGDSIWVQAMPLYNGARMSAYVFRRYTDIRLVVAAELGVANFGGDWDNFTYPRYALDFAMMRAYDAAGRPVVSPDFFAWGGTTGVQEGDAVFIIGNPGATRRLTTVSQLIFQRDIALPSQLQFHESRIAALTGYRNASRNATERSDLLVQVLSLSNRWKPIPRRIEGLQDPAVMGRRVAIERMLTDSIAARPELLARYRTLFTDMAEVQRQRTLEAVPFNAFSQLQTTSAGSTTLQAAYWAWRIQHGPADSVARFRQRLAAVRTIPAALEQALLALAVDDIARAYGPAHPFTVAARRALPEAGAAAMVLADTSGRRRAAAGELAAHPAMQLMDVIMPTLLPYEATQARLDADEARIAAQIGRARFEVYGPSIPPDGSSSPRIADGVVQSYTYNGTLAPPYTTFYGVYDRNRSHGDESDWALPHRWQAPPVGLDLGTPLNLISTVDSYGGNSGSPAVTKDLRIVGLNFDRNIDAMIRDYVYLPERGRNVMVDVRAIQAALTAVYRLDRIVRELVNGGM